MKKQPHSNKSGPATSVNGGSSFFPFAVFSSYIRKGARSFARHVYCSSLLSNFSRWTFQFRHRTMYNRHPQEQEMDSPSPTPSAPPEPPTPPSPCRRRMPYHGESAGDYFADGTDPYMELYEMKKARDDPEEEPAPISSGGGGGGGFSASSSISPVPWSTGLCNCCDDFSTCTYLFNANNLKFWTPAFGVRESVRHFFTSEETAIFLFRTNHDKSHVKQSNAFFPSILPEGCSLIYMNSSRFFESAYVGST